jgi:hypothetical protein
MDIRPNIIPLHSFNKETLLRIDRQTDLAHYLMRSLQRICCMQVAQSLHLELWDFFTVSVHVM